MCNRLTLANYQSALLATILLPILSGCSTQPQDISIDFTQIGAVGRAKHTLVPEYPQISIGAHKEGVVVIAVRVDEAGQVISASVLQSPDQAISISSLAAAKATTFSLPNKDGMHYTGHGKLYYYFKLSPSPHVELPSQDSKF
jgi:TonB family protein